MKLSKILLSLAFSAIVLFLLYISISGFHRHLGYVLILLLTTFIAAESLRCAYLNLKGKTHPWNKLNNKDMWLLILGYAFTLGCVLVPTIIGYTQLSVGLIFIAAFIFQWLISYILGSQEFRKIILTPQPGSRDC